MNRLGKNQGDKNRVKTKGKNLWYLAIILALASVMLFSLLAFYVQQQIKRVGLNSHQVFVDSTLDTWHAKLSLQVDKDLAVIEALVASGQWPLWLQSSDLAAVEQHLTLIKARLPFIQNLILVQTQTHGHSEGVPVTLGNQNLSFAEINLLNLAARGKNTLPLEIHKFGGQDQKMVVVRNVFDANNTIAGQLLVSMPFNRLETWLSSFANQNFYVEIWQIPDEGNELVVMKKGAPALKSGEPYKLLPVEGTRWKLALWFAAPSAVDTHTWQLNTGFGLAALILIVLIFTLVKLFSKDLRHDLGSIITLVRETLEGKRGGHYPVNLVEVRGTIDVLLRLLSERARMEALAGKNKNSGNIPSINQETSAVDIMFKSDQDEKNEKFLNQRPAPRIPAAIFRAYDIRGKVGDSLTVEFAHIIGQAFASEALDQGQNKIVVARDGRLSSLDFSAALIKGICSTGAQVVNIGQVPTPVLYFACHHLKTGTGIMVTGSHNPPQYNGFKMVLQGNALAGEAITALRLRIEAGKFSHGQGGSEEIDVTPNYITRIKSDVRLLRPMNIVVDCGNGVAGDIAPKLFAALGCKITPMYCEVDGNFPNHHPDPSQPENLQALIDKVVEINADVGLAFDGDGDRLGVIAAKGEIIWPDRQMMLYAKDVLARNPGGEIIFDVKCTRNLAKMITEYGGKPTMWKTGHSLIKAKLKETNALLAGEMSGHIFFKERWYGFDDALYTAARLLEILSMDKRNSSEIFADFPDTINTPEIRLDLTEGEHFSFMDKLVAEADFPDGKLITLDGLRVEFSDGWGLVRASNTTPSLVLRFEAMHAEAMESIQQRFRELLLKVDPKLTLPF